MGIEMFRPEVWSKKPIPTVETPGLDLSGRRKPPERDEQIPLEFGDGTSHFDNTISPEQWQKLLKEASLLKP